MCEVDESLKDKLKKFRFRKETNNAAILSKLSFKCHSDLSPDKSVQLMFYLYFLVKIDMVKQLVILEEEYEASPNDIFICSFCFNID